MLELIFTKLLEISIQASFFILAVILIRFCFRRLPKRYVCVLWALVAVRLILPFEITSPVSLVSDTSEVFSPTAIQENPVQDMHLQNNVPNNILNNIPQNMQNSAAHTPQEDTLSTDAADKSTIKIDVINNNMDVGSDNGTNHSLVTASSALTLTSLLALIWLLGMLVFLTYDLIAYLRLKYRLRAAIHEQDNIWYSDQIPSPFVLGCIKPRIYVPFSVHKEQLPYIIAHEQAHISHLDHLSKLLAALLLGVYWFHPFIWIAYLLYCKDLELACDERVITKLGSAEKKPYSEALLVCSVTDKALLQSPLSFSEVAIKDRIVNILNYKKPGFWGVLLAVMICAITGVCFLTSPADEKEPSVDAKTLEFLEQTTTEILDQVTTKYHVSDAFYVLPDTPGKESYYRITTTGTDGLKLYGLVNGQAMILRDGDTTYPLYDIQWPHYESEIPGNTPDIKIYKADFDSDGAKEYAVYQDKYDENQTRYGGMTILEIEENTLRVVPFTLSDMQKQLERISFEYADEKEEVHIYIDSKQQDILDVAWVNKMYQQSTTRLSALSSPRIQLSGWNTEELVEQNQISVSVSFVAPEDEEKSFVAASFLAPVTYTSDGKFLIGDITIDYLLKNPNLLTQYSTQLDDYPGTVLHTGHNEFTVTVETQDYGCLIATDPNTRETVYIWPDDYIQESVDRYWPPQNNATPSKDYPLEIVDDVVREVPARVLTENVVEKYAFGEDVLETTYKLHPYGIKQYILRENGTLHVNIGYEAPEHVAFQYLTFAISDNGETASLEDYGTGYYLLYLNDIEALDAFRDTYTGEGRVLPRDTSQLPWDWLLAMNREENDTPQLKEADLPVVQQNHQFTYFPGYNLTTDRFNGFIVSERVVNGEVFTEFRYRDNTDDIRILTGTNHYEVVSINYNGEEKPLPAQHLDIFTGGIGGSYGTVYYADVTGDTQKELIFEWGAGGTGAWDNYCYVYNPETMESYPIDLDVSPMTSKLKVTLTDFEPKGGTLSFNLAYENQTADVKDQLYFSFDPENDTTKMSLAEANRYFNYNPDTETHNVYYNPETGCFEAEVWIAMNNTIPMTYAGELNVRYIWDAVTGKFVIDLDTVKLVTSNNNSAGTDTSAQDADEPTAVYYPTTYYYSPAQYMKDVNWEDISTRITGAENEALQKFLPYLTEEEKFVWIYLLPESTYDNGKPVYAHKQVSIRELLADQMDTDGVDLVEPIVDEFCFADLFQTGSTDLIMLLRNQSYEWLIFHEEDGVMYCIDMYVRWLSDVREDGLYSSSGSASDTSYHRMTFSDGVFTIETIADITHYQYETHEEYYIDGVKKTAAEYAAWESDNLTELVPRYTPLQEGPSGN